MILLRMVTGEVLELFDMEPDDLADAIDRAKRLNVFINVHNTDEHKLGVNPNLLVYWELKP